MPQITVNQGGPDIPDGVYPVTLVEIAGPKTVTAQRGPKAGQDIDLFDWTFAIDSGPKEGETLEASTSTASGPRSKMYAWLTALFGGVAPPIGASFDTTSLHGRRAVATIRKDESGWPRIENLSAMVGQAAPAPAAAPTLQQSVAETTPGNLPF
jgi:hypothetical protein